MTSNGLPAVESVARRRDAIRAQIASVGDPAGVEITAVTKAFPPEIIEVAVAAGFTAVGENYAQELSTKVGVLDRLAERGTRPRVDFIGQLQSNKVRQLVGVVDRWCSVDRPSLATELAKRAEGAEVLVQVDTTGEPGKGGCPLDVCPELVERCRESGLRVVGLLSVGPTVGGPEAARSGFTAVAALADDLELPVRSLGMTHDLEVAIECGSTNVRIGTALFGQRPVSADS
ncbi:MAG: YggS family pyridoxal phosphate enzyme [Actinomycetota bacterium]